MPNRQTAAHLRILHENNPALYRSKLVVYFNLWPVCGMESYLISVVNVLRSVGISRDKFDSPEILQALSLWLKERKGMGTLHSTRLPERRDNLSNYSLYYLENLNFKNFSVLCFFRDKTVVSARVLWLLLIKSFEACSFVIQLGLKQENEEEN